jgi:hypothetical protein
VTATDYKESRDMHVTPGCKPNGLQTKHSPKAKKGGATLKQILDVQLFRRFQSIPDDFGHGTSSIKKDISLPFHGVQERPN